MHNLELFALLDSQEDDSTASGDLEEDKENSDSTNQAGTSEPTEEFPELDSETLQLLSDDEEADKGKKSNLHPKLASTWQKILSEGLKREKKMALLDKYLRSGNCPFQTPKLNIEIEASIKEASVKRDRFFAADLDLCGSSLAALGSGISMIFNGSTQEIDTKELLTRLIESGKLMCELHNQLIKARKAFLYPCVDKKARQILDKTQHGEFLFGPDLSQKIKTAKAVEKLGLSLKQPTAEKKPTFQASSSLNWRGPPARGRGKAGFKRFNFQRNSGQYGSQGFNRQPNRQNNNQTQQNTTSANFKK